MHFRTMTLDVQRAEDVACLRGQGGVALPRKLVWTKGPSLDEMKGYSWEDEVGRRVSVSLV